MSLSTAKLADNRANALQSTGSALQRAISPPRVMPRPSAAASHHDKLQNEPTHPVAPKPRAIGIAALKVACGFANHST